MTLLNRPASRVARRLLAALAALALAAPTTPAFALRAGLEEKVEKQLANELHGPAMAGAEENNEKVVGWQQAVEILRGLLAEKRGPVTVRFKEFDIVSQHEKYSKGGIKVSEKAMVIDPANEGAIQAATTFLRESFPHAGLRWATLETGELQLTAYPSARIRPMTPEEISASIDDHYPKRTVHLLQPLLDAYEARDEFGRGRSSRDSGLEEDVSRFALPPALASAYTPPSDSYDASIARRIRWTLGVSSEPSSVAGSADWQVPEAQRALVVGARENHENAIRALQATPSDYVQAGRNFSEAARQWRLLVSAVPWWARGLAADALVSARAGAAFTEARGLASRGAGVGIEYYKDLQASQEAYYDLSDPVAQALKGVDKAETAVLVRNVIQVFVTVPAAHAFEAKLSDLRLGAQRYLGAQVAFQVYAPQLGLDQLPPNAIVLTATDTRPHGLRKDVAAVDINAVNTFDDVLLRAANYQLGLPAAQALTTIRGVVPVGDKTLLFA